MSIPKFIFKDILSEQDTTNQINNNNSCAKLMIRAPSKINKQGIILSKNAQNILLPSFATIILGKPNSGKSHLISELINLPQFYYQRFDRILYIGPTRYDNCIHDNYNTINNIDIQFIQNRLKDCNNWARNILLIFDDVISQIPQQQKSRLQQLFFNRRHQIKNATISIIITSQKLTSVPTWIRSSVNSLFVFPITKGEIKILFNQIPLISNIEKIKLHFQKISGHQFIYLNLQKGCAFDSLFNII